MPLPLTDPDTLFEELLQDLPAESVQLARACQAFVRAKKGKPPAQLLRVVFFYCGLDKPWREVAGTLTALYESMTDQAIAERLRACGPWGKRCSGRCCPWPPWSPCPRGGVLWSSTRAVCKPQARQALRIACTARWTWCPGSFSRCWSAMSIPAKRASPAPSLRVMSPWQTAAMRSATA